MCRHVAFLISLTVAVAARKLSVRVDDQTGIYTLLVDAAPWYESPGVQTVCISRRQTRIALGDTTEVTGSDKCGSWKGVKAIYKESGSTSTAVVFTFKEYTSDPGLMVATATFPNGLDTCNCGTNRQISTRFPAFSTTSAKASSLHTLSWRGGGIATTAAALGLEKLGANGLDSGPVVSTEPETGATLVWSTLDSHKNDKIVPQTTVNGTFAMGIAATIPSIPINFSHSFMFSLAPGGATAGLYSWGSRIQSWYETTRLNSVALSDIGYYTDDGAYYYVWGGGGQHPPHDKQLNPWIPMRPWPAEEGLVLVKDALYEMGLPAA